MEAEINRIFCYKILKDFLSGWTEFINQHCMNTGWVVLPDTNPRNFSLSTVHFFRFRLLVRDFFKCHTEIKMLCQKILPLSAISDTMRRKKQRKEEGIKVEREGGRKGGKSDQTLITFNQFIKIMPFIFITT